MIAIISAGLALIETLGGIEQIMKVVVELQHLLAGTKTEAEVKANLEALGARIGGNNAIIGVELKDKFK